MKPMFSYMGSKYRLARKYGQPEFPTVIEPFAGSAAYSLFWDAQKVILFDINPVICELWKFLIGASKDDILSLPIEFEDISSLPIPEGAKHLIGFWVGKGRTQPANKRSAWGKQYQHSQRCRVWSESCRTRIANQVDKIRSWEIHCDDYSKCPDIRATWLIDPPYEVKGSFYPFNKLDFEHLAKWCHSRTGQVFVCENDGAQWMPFAKFQTVRGTNGKHRTGVSRESLWAKEELLFTLYYGGEPTK